MAEAVVGADAGDGGGVGLVAALGGVSRAIDNLGAVPFVDLPLVEQAAAVDAVVRLRSRLEGVEAVALRAFDAGGEWALDAHRSVVAALSHRCRLSRAEARRRVRLARRLADAPPVADALAAGEITSEAARLLVAARRSGVEPEFDRDVEDLVGHARSLSHADLRVVLRYWSDRVDPDGAERRAGRVEQSSRAFLSRTVDDQVRVDAWLDPVGGTALLTAVERLEDELFRRDWPDAEAVHGADTTVAHLARTPSRRRADDLVELAIRATTAPADAKRPVPLVNVVMDAATFDQASADEPACRPRHHRPGCRCSANSSTGPSSPRPKRSNKRWPATSGGSCTTPPTGSPRSAPDGGSTPASPATSSTSGTAPAPTRAATNQPGGATPTTSPPGTAPTPTQPNGRLLCRYHHRLRQRLTHPPAATRAPDGTLTHHRHDGTPITGPPPRHRAPS